MSEGPLGEIFTAMQESRTHAEMRRDAFNAELHAFIDGLSTQQLITLRHMLNLCKKSQQFLDGQIFTVLRVVRGVDPDTGRSVEDALSEIAGDAS